MRPIQSFDWVVQKVNVLSITMLNVRDHDVKRLNQLKAFRRPIVIKKNVMLSDWMDSK